MNILSTPRTRSPEDHTLIVPWMERVAMFLGVTIPFLGLLACIILFWGRGVGSLELILLASGYALTVIGITVGYHRLYTHRAFEAIAPVRLILAVLGSFALQGPLIQWCAIHRRHHQESDREGDPHSPHQHGNGIFGFITGFWHSHVGWLFHPDPADMERSIADLLKDPVARWADKWFWALVALGLIIPAGIGLLVHHSWAGAVTALLWGGLVRIFIQHHATFSINSVCHVWGSRPFKSSDQSRNNPIFGVVSFGEGWHNNHHAFPTSARHGLRWWQLDLSYLFIKTLQIMGLAWNVRVPSETAQRAKARDVEPAPVATDHPNFASDVAEKMSRVNQVSTPV